VSGRSDHEKKSKNSYFEINFTGQIITIQFETEANFSRTSFDSVTRGLTIMEWRLLMCVAKRLVFFVYFFG
jgi:hypothetical protein